MVEGIWIAGCWQKWFLPRGNRRQVGGAGGNKTLGNKWETLYQWCANAAPEYLFDASFDEWMDACLSNRGKKKRR